MSEKKSSGCKRAAILAAVAVALIFCIIPMIGGALTSWLNAPPDPAPISAEQVKRRVADAYRKALGLAESGQTADALGVLHGIEPNARSSGIEIAIRLKRSLELIEEPAAALAFLVKMEIESPDQVASLRAGDCPASLKCGGPITEEKAVLALQKLLPELPAAVEAERLAMAERERRAIEETRKRQIAAIEAAEKAKADAAEAQRQAAIEAQFSKWDGSHIALVARVKASMNNPASFEHVETRYSDSGRFLSVVMKFRGTNAFNAVVTNIVVAEVTYDGEVVSVSKF